MQCKECGVDVPVNVNYPISEVTCLKCWAKKKSDEKWQKFVKPIRAGALAKTPPYPCLLSSLSSPRVVLAAVNPWYHWVFRPLRTCVKGSYAALDGSNGYKMRLSIYRSRGFPLCLNLTQSVATHKPAFLPLISKTYRTEPWHWPGSGAIIGSSARHQPLNAD